MNALIGMERQDVTESVRPSILDNMTLPLGRVTGAAIDLVGMRRQPYLGIYLGEMLAHLQNLCGSGSVLTVSNYEIPPSPAVSRARVLSGFDEYFVDNWDGEDSLAISAETMAAAQAFLRWLPPSISDPAAAPGEDGTIGLEWIYTRGKVKKTFIDIGPGEHLKLYSRSADGAVLSAQLTVSQFSRDLARKVFPGMD